MAARQSGTQARANLAEVAGRVVAVVKRTPDGARLEWTVEAADDLVAVIDPADLAEAIGALAENAARYAEKAVRISARRAKSKLTIRVCDDGPGIPDEDLMRVLERGRRLDEGSVGEGLGLAIATDIAEAARGRLTLEPGKEGLCAVLELTAAGT
nr:ATP-binding protein [Rhizobium metallidurans]